MMTTDIHTRHDHDRDRERRGLMLEYRVYFALVFLISLPTAFFAALFPSGKPEARRFFVAEAWAMAQRITPQIFSA